MNPLRIGIVGAGANTRFRHIPGFQKIKNVEIAAVANRTRESGEKAAKEFGIPKVFDDWRELVNSKEIDAVCVGTWPCLHCPVSLAALGAGKHLLTEARMAMNLAEARLMYQASVKSRCVAMVVPSPYWLETEPTVKSMIAQGFLGEVLDIHVTGLSGGFDLKAPIHWRQRRDYSGNNILSLGILNETVRRYFGDEESVFAEGKIFKTERTDSETGKKKSVDVPESLAVIARMKSEATAVYHVSGVAKLGPGLSIQAFGTEGSVQMENDGSVFVAGKDETAWRKLEVPPEKRGGWRVEQDFVDAIRTGKPVTHTRFVDGVKYMEFTEAVHQSLREYRTVNLPLS